MKQKYVILKNDEKNELIIQEYAELDKEMLSLLCEESYNGPFIESAISAGKDALIVALRTQNLYPPGLFAARSGDWHRAGQRWGAGRHPRCGGTGDDAFPSRDPGRDPILRPAKTRSAQ